MFGRRSSEDVWDKIRVLGFGLAAENNGLGSEKPHHSISAEGWGIQGRGDSFIAISPPFVRDQ